MKKIFVSVFLVILFVVILSLLIVGIDNKKISDGQHKNSLLDENISRKIKESYNKEDLKIDVYITKKNKVDSMNIEEYVLGVVSAEMPAEFDLEALKAQAIAARTYGLAHKENFGGRGRFDDNNADVDDTVSFQVFMYKDERMKLWPQKNRQKYWNKINKAVKETKGEVLVYDDELVMAPYYFSTSSGKTENSLSVFNKEIPYLKSVESPGEEKSPKFETEFKYSYKEFEKILRTWNPKFNIDPIKIKNQIYIMERSNAGSVIKIKVGNENVSGQKFRNLFNLSSANFYLKFTSQNIIIKCKGYGHGVGMSQWGANSMAKRGYSYKKILRYYYKGTDVIKLKVND